MNQSLAMLMKLRLFPQGSQSDDSDGGGVQIGDKKEKKHKRWGKSRHERRHAKNGISMVWNDTQRSSPLSRSIREEDKGTAKARDGEKDSGKGQEGDSKAYGSGKRHGKLRGLKNKMSIPDLTSFRSFSQNGMQASGDREARNGDTGKNELVAQELEPRNQRQSLDMSHMGRDLVYEINSSSSVWSTRSLNFPVKTEDPGHASTASSVRFSSSAISGSSAVTAPNKPLVKSHTTRAFNHSRSGSMEIKGSKLRSVPIGRRRSRTVGVSDYTGSGGSDRLSSISAHLGRSRSNSQASRSPLVSSQNSSHIQFPSIALVQDAFPPTPPRLSNGSIPFPSTGSQQAVNQPLISRRSSSLVNAFSSFVNLRTSSASSMKGPSIKTVTPKFDVSLDDFPEPPEPESGESPKEYLVRLGQFGKFIGVILSNKNDPFKLQALKYFLTHYFDFDYDPLDISLRKFLMFLELPKETQQIDRLLTVFGQVYYEEQKATEDFCPWTSADQVYFLLFSLLMLHTDYFNPRNRFKMTKTEFIDLVHEDRQSDGCKIPKEILEYYHDNIVAKESPKFDFFSLNQQLSSSDSASQDKAPESQSSPAYSPRDIINASESMAYQDQIPVCSSFRGRVSSNSYSSYFPHVPISTSSSSTSVLQDDIDVYSHILGDSLSEIDMSIEVKKYWDDDCILRPLTSRKNKYNKYFSILKETKGGYLKIRKDCLSKVALTNFEILNEYDDNYRYLKIVQMGEIQRLTINKKFSIVGSVHRPSWKKGYAILTPSGLLVFDSMDWVTPQLVKDEKTNTSNYIIEYKPNASMIPDSPICCNGLLAIRKEDETAKSGIRRFPASDDDSEGMEMTEIPTNCVMHLYGSQRVGVWKCSNQYERDNWIDSINLMAAYDGCYYKPGCLGNTVISLRKHSMKERISKLEHTMAEKAIKLQELQTVMPLYRQCMPLCYKTRNDLTAHIRQLAVRMDWLVYETKRNEVYLAIIRQVDAAFEQCLERPPETDDFESRNNVNSINESFIFNEELIPAYHTEDNSKSNDSFEFDTSGFFLEGYKDQTTS